MKLYNYLNEELTYEQFLTKLKKDCSEFLDIWRKNNNINLYRGLNNINKFLISTPIKNRIPKDLSIDVHNELNKRFYKIFRNKTKKWKYFLYRKKFYCRYIWSCFFSISCESVMKYIVFF